MLPTKLRSSVSILKCVTSTCHKVHLRLVSSTGALEPVQLSYATYESTVGLPGQAPPLVIMHGLFGSKGNWNSLCKVYQQKTNPERKIIAIDARNHGDSPHNDNHTYAHMAADIKALLDQLHLEKVALMGHSMGGRTVMLFALKYPELVEKLIVADISPITTSTDLKRVLKILLTLRNLKLPRNMPLSAAKKTVGESLMPLVKSRDIANFLLTNLVQKSDGSYGWRCNIKVLLDNFENITTFPAIHHIVFDGPVLFLGGAKSDYIQKSDFPKILKFFPNAELKFIEGAGHWLHSEKPAEFLQLTLEFLNRKVSVH
ncbi:protein ABHD11 isoform X2 [Anoplophora glabripennis]|uniref:protein ABHD11 isoform X2 n=1 Tax=Anoplophora glabripennis TaxID=217634 RepID=UPI000873DF5B|nr:protein ABHD11 isoform X2 [Anoplophora glabripennis]